MTTQNTHLATGELERYRHVLLAKLSELIGDHEDVERESAEASAVAGDRVPRDMADLGSAAERESVLRDLAEFERRQVREIAEALERIDRGEYGICERTGEPIPKARLEAIPWARHTVEAAREAEVEAGGPRI